MYGTKFNVLSIPDKENVYVSLLSGSVSLITIATSKEQFLLPGETATYDKKSHQVSISKGGAEMHAAWITPSVLFTKSTLADICEVLSRRYDIKINIDSQSSKKYMYTFTLHDESVEEVLGLISSINPIEYSFGKDGTINIIE